MHNNNLYAKQQPILQNNNLYCKTTTYMHIAKQIVKKITAFCLVTLPAMWKE